MAHNNLGAVLQELGEYQKAALSYQKAIQIQPNFAEAHSNLGATLKELGERQKAISCYQEAIKIQPDNAEAHYNLGIVFKELGEHQKAITCNEKAINLKPDHAKAYNNILFTLLHFEKDNFNLNYGISMQFNIPLGNGGKLCKEAAKTIRFHCKG